MVKVAHILLILAVAVDVNTQFFDWFSAFQPPTLRPIFEPTKPQRLRTYETTERYQESGRVRTTEHTTKSVRKTTKTSKQTNKKRIDKVIDDGRNTINYDNPKTYTENPFVRPGVKPAIVNGPPITNKPPYVPRPIAGLDQNDDSSVTPELIIGPDEDYMTSVEKQRYIDLAEKKCEEYMSLSTVRVEAIPLVPSPSPVVVNVSSCARSIPLVVGGSVVTIQQFPHMALLGWTKIQSGGYSWKCGGSLVSERHVLTAAHCAYQERDDSVIIGPPRAVQLGSSRLDDPGAIVQHVSSVTRHPKYRPPQSYHDIAVVTMAGAVTFSPAIRPACMGAPPAPGDHFIATGWGKTEFGGEQSAQLRGVSLSVWSRGDCAAALGHSRKLPRGPDTSQTCAGDKDGGRDTCQGDSGGPAQVSSRCAWRVVSVTSAGRACGAPDTPALYANVPTAFVAKVAFGQADHGERQYSYDNKNTNSNRRRDEDQQNSDRNSEQNDSNRNSNNRQYSYDNKDTNSNTRRDDDQQNSNRNSDQNDSNRNNNNRQHSYDNPNSNRQQSDYNRQDSDSYGRPNDYNQQNSFTRENDYNPPNSNSNGRQNDYNQRNNYDTEDEYNKENGYNQNSNSQQNRNSNQNSNNQYNSYNNQNSNSYNQQNQWNKRTTTPKWSYNEGWNNNYNPTYIEDTDGRYRRTDEGSASRPQYYSGLDQPYSDESIWRT